MSVNNQVFYLKTSAFEYVLLFLICFALIVFLLSMAEGMAPIWMLVLVPFLVGLIYSGWGLIRPRCVEFTDRQMIIRPVWGARKIIAKASIVGVEDYVSPPFGALVVRIRNEGGRSRAVTVHKRLVLAGLGLRENGREVGMLTSSTHRAVSSWLGQE